MKKALLVAAALVVAAPAISVAQDDHQHDRGGRGSTPTAGRGAPQPGPAGGPPPSGSNFHAQGGGPQFSGGYRGAPNGQEAQGRGPPSGGQGYRPQGPGGYPQPGGYPGGGDRFARAGAPAFAHSPAPRGGGQPFGYGGRQYFRYQAPPYRYPVGYYGWNNHPWRRGEWLPPVFTSAAYYIDNWYDFGLWEPSYGYQWIRVGPDAVLINLADGQIADVVPGIYY